MPQEAFCLLANRIRKGLIAGKLTQKFACLDDAPGTFAGHGHVLPLCQILRLTLEPNAIAKGSEGVNQSFEL